MSLLEQLKERMNTPEFAESSRKYMEEYFAQIGKLRQKVSSKEYIDWLYKYISVNNHVDNESALYIYKGIDAENGQIVGSFLDYVKEIAIQQRVLAIWDDECEFENEKFFIKIKDVYIEIFRMYGQGSWIALNLLDKEQDYAYVKL